MTSARLANAQARRLDDATLARLRATGVLAGLLPAALRGDAPALTATGWLAALEALATDDPAAGWVAMTASTSTLLAPYVEPEVARAIWRAGDAPIMAGVFAPSGKLAGGRLVGRWAFASGCRHAAWFALGALTEARQHAIALVPASAVTIIDNWDTLGLGGTGSHDVAVDTAIDPTHTATVFGAPPRVDAPLGAAPLFGALAAGVAACALGIAAGALAVPAKEPSSAQLAGWAHARARVAAARAYLHAQLSAPAPDRGELRVAAWFAATEAAEAVRALFRLGGGGAIRAHHPLELALRDVETALSHRMVAERVLPTAARAMLGLAPPPPDL